jgi:hypothetical protein
MDVAVPNSHNLHSTITERLQKYTDLKGELIGTWHMGTVYIIPLVLYTAVWHYSKQMTLKFKAA